MKKELANRKEKMKIHERSVRSLLKKDNLQMLTGKARPRGCEKKDSEPKGDN